MPISYDYAQLKGFNFKGGMKVIPEFVGLLLALSIYTGAFIAEIVRAGILAVNSGQTEAANALGLRNGPTLRLVIIPQAMRVIIPAIDQPVSQPDQKLLFGRCYRLSGYRVCWWYGS